uniref:Lipocalin-like domain-containing protein n=1 Tax=Ignavibacterium album TaxID=591197 RepID=A0A7V2ZHN4_9BACT
MKKLFVILLVASTTLLYFGCSKSDDNGTNPTPPQDPIVGTWISEGADVAPGLVLTLKTVRIVATFNANNTYNVVATDSTGAQVTYTGTYTVTENTGSSIRSITLNQTQPTSVTSQGIYQVDVNGFLKYEVVQTIPAIPGFTPPTAAEGFGSTKYNGVPLGLTWIQNFVPANPTKEYLVGTWVSEGNNVAPGLKATLKTKKIVATFNANNTYTVVATDSFDVSVTYTGTFTTQANNNTSIRNITLNQTTPTSVTSQGIYRVTTKDLTYEVIQTTPAIPGFTPPVASEGFGSTKYNSIPLGATWIQKFVKQ